MLKRSLALLTMVFIALPVFGQREARLDVLFFDGDVAVEFDDGEQLSLDYGMDLLGAVKVLLEGEGYIEFGFERRRIIVDEPGEYEIDVLITAPDQPEGLASLGRRFSIPRTPSSLGGVRASEARETVDVRGAEQVVLDLLNEAYESLAANDPEAALTQAEEAMDFADGDRFEDALMITGYAFLDLELYEDAFYTFNDTIPYPGAPWTGDYIQLLWELGEMVGEQELAIDALEYLLESLEEADDSLSRGYAQWIERLIY